jgi:hypothetical protein
VTGNEWIMARPAGAGSLGKAIVGADRVFSGKNRPEKVRNEAKIAEIGAKWPQKAAFGGKSL